MKRSTAIAIAAAPFIVAAILIANCAHAGGRLVRPIRNPPQHPPAAASRAQDSMTCAALKAVGGGWWYPPCMR